MLEGMVGESRRGLFGSVKEVGWGGVLAPGKVGVVDLDGGEKVVDGRSSGVEEDRRGRVWWGVDGAVTGLRTGDGRITGGD